MEKIGEYTVIQKLGEGGFGVVYLGHIPERPGLGKVAIKVFRVHDANMAQMEASDGETDGAVASLRARFMREAELLRGLADYPHIVNVYEPPKLLPDGSAYYVMPYLERSLVDEIGKDQAGQTATFIQNLKLRPKKLSSKRVLEILKELAAALSVVHEKGLVHRDIKPANGAALVRELEKLDKRLSSPSKLVIGFYGLLAIATAGAVVQVLSGTDNKVVTEVVSEMTEMAGSVKEMGQQQWQGMFSEARLTVVPDPEYARIRILNIQQDYADGIELERGESYHIEVWAAGYKTHSEWIELDEADKKVEVTLRRTSS